MIGMEFCFHCFLPFIISLFFSWFLLYKVRIMAYKKRLFDSINDRKVHIEAIPRLGGIAFFPVFMIVSSLFLGISIIGEGTFNLSISIVLMKEWIFILCSTMILYITGIGDDLVGLPYRQKFLIQILVAVVFIMSGLWINNLYGIFLIYEIPFYWGLPLTLFLVVLILNAINFIDGIDGLASGLSMLAFLVYGYIFSYLQLWFYSMLSFVALGMLVSFFYYNVFGNVERKSKIFMGDGGALTIGMLISVCAIKICHFGGDIIFTHFPYIVVIVFSLLIVPIFDVIQVVIHRIRTRCHLFKPDKNHIHHKFLRLGLSHKSTMAVILLVTIIFGVSNVLLYYYININILVLFDILLWTIINILLARKIQKSESYNLPNQSKTVLSKRLK